MGHPRKDKEYQLVSTKNPTKRAAAVGLLQYKADLFIISLKINLFSPWYRWKIAELALNNNHSLTITADILTKIHVFYIGTLFSFLHTNSHFKYCKSGYNKPVIFKGSPHKVK
jgi:hypothetical protein